MGRNICSLDMYIDQIVKISSRVNYQVDESNDCRNGQIDAFIKEFMEDYYRAVRLGLLQDNFQKEQEPLKTLHKKYEENIILKSSALSDYLKKYQELLVKKVQGDIDLEDEKMFYQVRNNIIQYMLKMGTYYSWLIAHE